MRPADEAQALFWCHLLDRVIFGDVKGPEINRTLREICQQEQRFPSGALKKPSLSTLRRKLRAYQKGGLKALCRRPRSDRGKPRAAGADVIAQAVAIKKDQPRRSHDAINLILKEATGKTLARSTLFHHLKLHGATKLKLGLVREKVRCRWTRDRTHALWVGDFMDGVTVVEDGTAFTTYLCLWIDCCSRFIVEGRYYLRSAFDILIDSLLRAFAAHGLPDELYVDNAKVYHTQALQAACYALKIRLIHSTPRDPAPKGLVERFFRTQQNQFEAEVRAGDCLTLDALNKAFAAYLDVAYHRRVHSETGQTPEQAYRDALAAIRHVDMHDAVRFFLKQVPRTVDRTFSDVRVEARCYRVDKTLRGDKVLVRYDPYGDLSTVFIHAADGAFLGQGNLHHRETGEDAPPLKTQAKAQFRYLDLLQQEHARRLAEKVRGIDYRKLIQNKRWSFSAFVQKLSLLMARKGGLAAFSAAELEVLAKAHHRLPVLSPALLERAVVKAHPKTITYILAELQTLCKEN